MSGLRKFMMGGGLSAGNAEGICGAAGTVAATGSTIADAALIGFSVGIVTAADGTKGVQLPTLLPGEEIVIFNNANAVCKVWPGSSAVGISVSGTGVGTAAAALSVAAYKTCRFIGYSTTQVIAHSS